MKVSVVYALPERQIIRDLDLHDGATVKTAVQRSGLPVEFPEIDSPSVPVGIFGRVASPAAVLRPGDRVEIYRPLREEPKEPRRRRVRRR